MSRVAVKIELSADETDELNRWLKCGKTEQRKVERAKIILRCAESKTTHQIAKELGTRPSRVSKWRKRFAKLRVRGLEDEPRSGRKVINEDGGSSQIPIGNRPIMAIFVLVEDARQIARIVFDQNLLG